MKTYLTLPLLCLACSSPSDKQQKGIAQAVQPASKETTQPVLDQKNGFRTHHFGDELSTFPGLQAQDFQKPGPVQIYQLQDRTKENFQLGEGRLTNIYYEFYNGRFFRVSLATVGESATLVLAAAKRLYGPGRQPDSYKEQIWWEGQVVTASFQSQGQGYTKQATLYIWNNVLAAQAAAAQQEAVRKVKVDL